MATDIIIRKQRFTIRAATEAQATALRLRLNDEWQYKLLHAVEGLAASVSLPPGATLYVEKISVPLGTVTEDELVTAALRGLESALYKKVTEALAERFSNPTDEPPAGVPLVADSINDDVSDESALLHFLDRGYFPWWYISGASPAALLAGLHKSGWKPFLQKLVVAAAPHERQGRATRFAQHLPDALQEAALSGLERLLRHDDGRRDAAPLLSLSAKQTLRAAFALGEAAFNRHLLQFLLQHDEAENGRDAFVAYLRQQTKSESSGGTAIVSREERDRDATAEPCSAKPHERVWNKKPDAHGIYIANAGLILLHPFLPSLFRSAGLLTAENGFVSDTARQRATVLLHYLQNSEDAYNEWEMAFNKILCGLPVGAAITGRISLSEREKQECGELWAAVADHWQALRGASASAVIETFIRRPGKISFADGHWLLQVERSGTDVLLDRLPWGFGVVRLPWLDALIYTEW